MNKLYVKIVDGKIVEPPQRIPSSYKNISGFNLIDDETLRVKYGWYPVEKDTYNSKTEELKNPEILENKVVYKADYKEIECMKQNLIIECNSLVKDKLKNSDWKIIRSLEQTQLLSEGKILKKSMDDKGFGFLLTYRQRLRDISNEFESNVATKTTPEEVIETSEQTFKTINELLIIPEEENPTKQIDDKEVIKTEETK